MQLLSPVSHGALSLPQFVQCIGHVNLHAGQVGFAMTRHGAGQGSRQGTVRSMGQSASIGSTMTTARICTMTASEDIPDQEQHPEMSIYIRTADFEVFSKSVKMEVMP